VRSFYPHARITAIGTEGAKKLPGVLAVITGEDLADPYLFWMPTLFFDKQMVLAKGEVLFQSQQVAFVVAEDRMEAGLEAVHYYDPPNLTFPLGTYIRVVDFDKGTGEVEIHRFVAVDDCGNIINPMIVEGQIHGGLTEGLAIPFMQEISYDEGGKVQGGTFMDYLVRTAVEKPNWEIGKTCTPPPHHPFGAKGVGESPNFWSPAAFVNAVVDALAHLGVRDTSMC
jgi:carbon-monoxide dehydrogenase large subunit